MYVELPQLVLIGCVRSLVLGSGHFSRLQIVFTVLGPTVLVCKLYHSITIRSGRDGHVGSIQVRRRLIDLLSRIDISGKFAAELLTCRWLTAVLLVVKLLVRDGVIARAHSFLDDHASCVAASVRFLPQCCRIDLAPGAARVDRVLLDDLVDARVGARALDHCPVSGPNSSLSTS